MYDAISLFKMRVLQIGRDHPLVKFVDPGLEAMMGRARSERRRVAVTADSIATRTVVTREVRTEEGLQ